MQVTAETDGSSHLRRIIHLVSDLSAIGGIPGRTRSTILAAQGRPIQHLCLSVRNEQPCPMPGVLCAAYDEQAILDLLGGCHPTDTVVLTPNNALRGFPPAIRAHLTRLPILHMASGQLSFILQDSSVLADLDYVDSYKASRILCLSEMDIQFHRQLGIHALTKVRLPVQTRAHNTYSAAENRFVTYVGRIDFHAKGAERLIPIARLMRERGLPPLQIFTTDGRNSPDLPAFTAMLAQAGLADWVTINYNITDKPTLYRNASLLLLPSKKESFGNVILEAFSFGVPVMAPSYAPGPAEIIRHGTDGFLLDDFAAQAMVARLENLGTEELERLSRNCFARHLEFSMEQYLSSLEAIAAEAARGFSGQNDTSVFPRLKSLEVIARQRREPIELKQSLMTTSQALRLARNRLSIVESSRSWRYTKPLRWVRTRLGRFIETKLATPEDQSTIPQG
jgi:glycosyltransferase involved in cell wall biosynthesis